MKKGSFTCWLEKWLTYKIKGPFRKLTTLSDQDVINREIDRIKVVFLIFRCESCTGSILISAESETIAFNFQRNGTSSPLAPPFKQIVISCFCLGKLFWKESNFCSEETKDELEDTVENTGAKLVVAADANPVLITRRIENTTKALAAELKKMSKEFWKQLRSRKYDCQSWLQRSFHSRGRKNLCGTIKFAALKAPGFGERKSQYLDDIAALTGGETK
ncbi:hypothetical protein YC2023_121967 [Brassica napus]